MLGIINVAIREIIAAYDNTFTDDFWEGRHDQLWPLPDPHSPRNKHWTKRLKTLRGGFEKEIKRLEGLYDKNDDLRKNIRTLRDQLFSGTSVAESRKNVDLAKVTILEGRNIKLLTMVRTQLEYVLVSQ